MTDATISSIKSGIGKTGVALWYHTQQEYKSLSKAQKRELYEWRTENESNKSRKVKTNSTPSSEIEISALIQKRFDAKLKKVEEKKAKKESAKEELKVALIS